MFVLALTGLHGSGKGVLTHELVTNHNFVTSSFSSTAKHFALQYDPYIAAEHTTLVDIVERHGWTYAKSCPGVRDFLNGLGRALLAVDPQYVMRRACDDIRRAHRDGHHIVFDDCYTVAEGEFIHRRGGMIVHVAPEYDLEAALGGDEFQNNLPTPDLTIANPGTPGSLHRRAEEIVETLTRRTQVL